MTTARLYQSEHNARSFTGIPPAAPKQAHASCQPSPAPVRSFPRTWGHFGFCLSCFALASLLLGRDLTGHPGRDRWYGLLLSVFGVAVGAAISAHHRRAVNPPIDLSVLKIKTFTAAALLGGSLFRMTISAPTFVLPLFPTRIYPMAVI
jgi:hypothetical protein